MKKYLLLLFILFSCKKEIKQKDVEQLQQTAGIRNAGGSQSSFWYTGSNSNVGSLDKGVSAVADVVKFKGGNFYMKSWFVSFYFTDTAGVSKWTQWGYATNKDLGNITIITTWKNPGGSLQEQIFPPTIHLNTVPLNYGGRSKFSIYNVEGTTKWRYARDDIDIEEADLEATAMSGTVEVKIEGQSSTPGSFNLVHVQNFSTLHNGIWTVPASGQSGGTGMNGFLVYPIEGQVQNNLLAKGELNMGGNGAQVPYFAFLWQ